MSYCCFFFLLLLIFGLPKWSSFYFNFLIVFLYLRFFPGLFPAVLNLASMADITTNATCGSLGPEMFCKLVEHVPGQPVRNPQCRICNQRSPKLFGRYIYSNQLIRSASQSVSIAQAVMVKARMATISIWEKWWKPNACHGVTSNRTHK